MTGWRVLGASMVLALVAPACGVTLGSQGAAETARENLAPIVEAPDAPNPFVGTTPPSETDVAGDDPFVAGSPDGAPRPTVTNPDGSPVADEPFGVPGTVSANGSTVNGSTASGSGGTGSGTGTGPGSGASGGAGTTNRPAGSPTTTVAPIVVSPVCQAAIRFGSIAQAVWLIGPSTPLQSAQTAWIGMYGALRDLDGLVEGQYRQPLVELVQFMESTIGSIGTTEAILGHMAAMADDHRRAVGSFGVLVTTCSQAGYVPGGALSFNPDTDVPTGGQVADPARPR